MAKILVTGGTGYIGSHTAVELIGAGYDVLIVDDLSNSDRGVVDRIEKITGYRCEFQEMDLCNASAVKALFEGHPDLSGIIHFAAKKAVGESVQVPLTYYRTNLFSLVNLLEYVGGREPMPFVFSSSCTVYGSPKELPVTESSPVQAAFSPYGNTKQICEEILIDAVASGRALTVEILRYFNPIGAHSSALIGELPLGVPNNLVPFITQTAYGLRECLSVFGNDYATPDGSCIRDYIHVVDLAKAHVVALSRLLEGQNASPVETFNLGTGRGQSVLEVIAAFEKVSGERLNYRIAPRRDGDVPAIYADTKKANEVLGWRAERSLEEAVASAWAWEKAFRESVR
ncbi:MAG: UDP-glucose 4-epimerase GalE [Puniceicoccaceae bacterium]